VRYRLKVGVLKEYEPPIGTYEIANNPFQAHNGRAYKYHKEVEYFDEKAFATIEDLERYKYNVYPNFGDYEFSVEEV